MIRVSSLRGTYLPPRQPLKRGLLPAWGQFHDITKRLQNIKREFMSLGKMLKGAQVVLSSVLQVGDWDPGRRQHMDQVNDWLRSWCYVQGFGFCDLRCVFERLDMLTLEGEHPTKRDMWMCVYIYTVRLYFFPNP